MVDLNGLLEKIQNSLKAVGQKLAYAVFLMYYAYKRKETPKWAKRTIIGALAYFISPIDAIPDLAPILGFTDDFTVIAFGLATIAYYVNDEVKQQACSKVEDLFGEVDEAEIEKVNKRL